MAESTNVAQLNAKFTATGLSQLNSGIDRLHNKSLSLTGVLAKLGGAFAIKQLASSMFQATRQLEDYRMRIRAVSNTIEQADSTFKRIKEWAEVNPVNTDDAIAAFVRLRTAAVQNAEGALQPIADLASVMGRRMEDVAGGVVTMNSRVLRQLGVIVTRESGNATIRFGEVTKTVKGDIDSTRAALLEVLEKAVPGAMERMKNTATGTLNTMGGMWQKLMTDIMGFNKTQGIFAGLTEGLNTFRDAWEKWMASTSYQDFLANVTKVARGVSDLVGTLWKHKDAILSVVAALGAYKIAIAALPMLSLIRNMTTWLSLAPAAVASLKDLKAWFELTGISIKGLTGGWLGLTAAVGTFLLTSAKLKAVKIDSELAATALEKVRKNFANANSSALQKEINAVKANIKSLDEQAKKSQVSVSEIMNAEQSGDSSKLLANSAQQSDLRKKQTEQKAYLTALERQLKTTKEIEEAAKKANKETSIDTSPSSSDTKKSAAELKIERLDAMLKASAISAEEARDSLRTFFEASGLKEYSEDWNKVKDKLKEYDNTIQSLQAANFELGMSKEVGKENAALEKYLDTWNKVKGAWSANNAGSFTETEWASQQKNALQNVISGTQAVIAASNEMYENDRKQLDAAISQLSAWRNKLADIPSAVKAIDAEIKKLSDQKSANAVENILAGVSRDASQAKAAYATLSAMFTEQLTAENATMEQQAEWSDRLKNVYFALSSVVSTMLEPELEKLDRQLQNGTIETPAYIAQLEQLKNQYIGVSEAVSQISEKQRQAELSMPTFQTRMTEAAGAANKAFQELDSTLTLGIVDAFENAIKGSGNFGEALADLGKQIMATVARMLIMKQIMSMFGFATGGGVSAATGGLPAWYKPMFPVVHTGGIIGGDNLMTRSLPKFHTGGIVGSQEQLAILKKGEGVFTKGQMKALGAGISDNSTYAPVVNVTVNNSGGGDMTNEQAQNLGNMINKAVEVKVAETMYKFGRGRTGVAFG